MEDKNKQYGYGKKSFWQWLVIYIIIGGIIYGLVYYFVTVKRGGSYSYAPNSGSSMGSSQAQTSNQTQSPVKNQSSIILTSAGFSPAVLTIKAGATVTWTNKSGSDAAVNSNPHPIHTDYPPLNLGSFSDGGTLSLKFDKPGTYGYHNHLDPSEKGTIVVQ